MNIYPTIAIIGAGAYGTAIAIALSKNGCPVLLWGHNSHHIKQLKLHRCNHTYLPNIIFPSLLYLEETLSVTLNICKDILIAVPSQFFYQTLIKLKLQAKKNIRIIIASKGLDPYSGRLLKDITQDIFGNNIPIAIISGPTFAKELAMGLPTAITVATTDINFSQDIQNLLHCIKNFRVYSDTDVIGVQIAGVIKNIIAIGAGISDGMGFGANAKMALITRGFTEMSRFGVAIGATTNVFTGLSGLGDLILTCTNNQSRNRQFGILLGNGINVHHAKKKIGKIIEGFYNTKTIYMLSIQYKIPMPITEQIYYILYHNKNIYDAAHDLLNHNRNNKKIIT